MKYLVCADDRCHNWRKGDEFINGFEMYNDLNQAAYRAIICAKSSGCGFIVQDRNTLKNNECDTYEISPTDTNFR